MNLSLHINFDGRCQEAFEFYERVLGGKIGTMLQYKDSPVSSETPLEEQDKVIHANISINNIELAGGDLPPEHYAQPSGFYLLLGLDSEHDVKRTFKALSAHGEVILPPQKTFWSPCYAIVIDAYGVPWKLNCGN